MYNNQSKTITKDIKPLRKNGDIWKNKREPRKS
jgi:hypothetical protein